MSQWGARCLEAYKGFDYAKILQFYYGMDIEIRTAAVACDAADAGSDAANAESDVERGDADSNVEAVGGDGGDETVAHDVASHGGCSVSGPPASGSLTLLLCVIPLGVVARRRRSRALPAMTVV